jgi:hypothetical protein
LPLRVFHIQGIKLDTGDAKRNCASLPNMQNGFKAEYFGEFKNQNALVVNKETGFVLLPKQV